MRAKLQKNDFHLAIIYFAIGMVATTRPTLAYNVLPANPPRAIISGGTMKTFDGQLLRGTSLHVSKSYSSNANAWGLNKNNLIKLRDQGHFNMVRLNCLDPRAVTDGRASSAYSTILEEATTWTDSLVANCGAVGLYVMLDYHCQGMVWDNSTWDIRNFWRFYSPRYKDKTWVMYEIENEVHQGFPSDNNASTWPTNNEAEIYKVARNAAPNTIIATGMEPLFVDRDWSDYLKNGYGKAAGIDWTAGKDVWPWHDYGNTTAAGILATKNGGIPMICSEFSYAEDGWYNTSVDGSKNITQWLEKSNVQISWCDWKSWNAADQGISIPWITGDAVAKGYTWWNTTKLAEEPRPFASMPQRDFFSQAQGMIQVNGRVAQQPARGEKDYFGLSILPQNLNNKRHQK